MGLTAIDENASYMCLISLFHILSIILTVSLRIVRTQTVLICSSVALILLKKSKCSNMQQKLWEAFLLITKYK